PTAANSVLAAARHESRRTVAGRSDRSAAVYRAIPATRPAPAPRRPHEFANGTVAAKSGGRSPRPKATRTRDPPDRRSESPDRESHRRESDPVRPAKPRAANARDRSRTIAGAESEPSARAVRTPAE